MRICNVCGVSQPISNFSIYYNVGKNRVRRFCKTCEKKKKVGYNQKFYYANLDKVRELCAKSKREWRKENPELAHQKDKENRNPVRQQIMNKVRWAVESGKLKRTSCIVCGKEKVDAHHNDYTKPLKVIWLCHAHHKELHKHIQEMKERIR